MRELGPVKEPEDEKSPKKKSLKGGFLASWMRRENGGEPDGKLDEQDLVDPEQDALFNDGFSKRWHKLFSGTMPVDNTAASDDNATNDAADNTASSQPAKGKGDKAGTSSAQSVTEELPNVDSLMDAARKQVEQAAKSADELKGEVEEQHDADRLTNKEITADVPSSLASADAKKGSEEPAEAEDFDVFTDDKPKPSKKVVPQDSTLNYEDMESTPEAADDLPPLKDNADRSAINVNPMHREDPFPRVDPREFAHQSDVEDNVEAPGAPTKGYRGLLVIDHPDRQMPTATTATTVDQTPPPQLPPQPEAFLPTAIHDTPVSVSTMPATSPSFVLPSKEPKAWPNPKHSRPVVGGAYTGPRLDRQLQALIDRPVSAEMTQLVDSLSEINRLRASAQQTASVEATEKPAELSHNESIAIPKSDLVQPEQAQTDEKTPVIHEASEAVLQTRPELSSKHTEGATPLATILKESPLAHKAIKPEATVAPAEEQPVPKPAPASTPPATPEPVIKPAPAPLYTPPAPGPSVPTSPRLQLPVIPQPSLYQIAIKRGILGGLAVSGAVIAAYLFG